ncbi:hypothetical protein [Streptomyces lydicus]|uniref:hypothetical protein n=1 Tax=Streptomyces lydicus TaxID=47763 RepID=UPI00101040F6|nr:hypothetical protein [Streptomyces lydicus]MCZ1012011.1 hypothetical protein [Streptomyces lydicus]
MPTYRVQATTQMFPKPEDWTTILETKDRAHAGVATGEFGDRPYPHATRWQRLFEGDHIILIRGTKKPHVKYQGRDAHGVERWWIGHVDKEGFGGYYGAYGPIQKVYAELMRSHHWYIDRHGLART